MCILETNSALLRAQWAALTFAATELPLRAICAAIVLPVKFFGKASANLNILTEKAFVLSFMSNMMLK